MNKIQMTQIILLCVATALILFVLYNTYMRSTSKPVELNSNVIENSEYTKIVLAGGCFWCTESEYNHLPGVIEAVSGYADSDKENPTYEETGSGKVRAREAVLVVYDAKIISSSQILQTYFAHIDPTDKDGQFGDRGHQYSPAIYYTNDEQKLIAKDIIDKINLSNKFDKNVAVEVLAYNNFYPAEEYHQDYKDKNPVRYNGYREASGRNSFIRLHWKDGSTTTTEIFNIAKPKQTDKESESKSVINQVSNVKPWSNFTDEDKIKRLKDLTAEQIKVTQHEGTEKPFVNLYDKNKEKGIYVDIVSGEPLYLSSDKYDSGTGWPSFVKPISAEVVSLKTDNYLVYSRTEVRSKLADSHLGHVFDDGPANLGGKRYCMNSVAMRFIPIDQMESEGYREFIDKIK
jgi:peptide methionine sulfoxide reductase msrA/msrB